VSSDGRGERERGRREGELVRFLSFFFRRFISIKRRKGLTTDIGLVGAISGMERE